MSRYRELQEAWDACLQALQDVEASINDINQLHQQQKIELLKLREVFSREGNQSTAPAE